MPTTHKAVDSDATARMAAMKLGQCGGCGNQTHKISVVVSCCGLRSRETRTALPIPGFAASGICLKWRARLQ